MVLGSELSIGDLVKETPTDFIVHKRVFSDPLVFDQEMERIFETGWVYVAHESEVAKGGDYKTVLVGRQPVIISRNSDDNKIYVMYNSCRHRGATVCQSEYGHSNYFRCGYHGWTYDNTGDLAGSPYEDGYQDDFDKSKMGLIRVPRVGNYRGFIFVSLSPTGPSLEDHLGNVRPYIDLFADIGPDGIDVVPEHIHKSFYNGNWKTSVENPNDNYHFEFTHASLQAVYERRGRPTATMAAGKQRRSSGKGAMMLDLGNGHHAWGGFDGPGTDWKNYRLGGNSMPPVFIFPNVVLIDVQIRHVVPLAVDKTELHVHLVGLKGVPDEINEERWDHHHEFYGAAGLGAPDDWEQFERFYRGSLSRGDEWVRYSRGLKYEVADSATGKRGVSNEKLPTSEVTLRAIYRQWHRAMTSA